MKKKQIKIGEPFLNYGIAGGVFKGKITVVEENSVVTSIEGSAYYCNKTSFYLDPRDPIGLGFKLR